jgi:hypothetical protein
MGTEANRKRVSKGMEYLKVTKEAKEFVICHLPFVIGH